MLSALVPLANWRAVLLAQWCAPVCWFGRFSQFIRHRTHRGYSCAYGRTLDRGCCKSHSVRYRENQGLHRTGEQSLPDPLCRLASAALLDMAESELASMIFQQSRPSSGERLHHRLSCAAAAKVVPQDGASKRFPPVPPNVRSSRGTGRSSQHAGSQRLGGAGWAAAGSPHGTATSRPSAGHHRDRDCPFSVPLNATWAQGATLRPTTQPGAGTSIARPYLAALRGIREDCQARIIGTVDAGARPGRRACRTLRTARQLRAWVLGKRFEACPGWGAIRLTARDAHPRIPGLRPAHTV
jgi:hypothetical protein